MKIIKIKELLLNFESNESKTVLLKYFENLLLLIGLFGVLPFIINSFYIFPAADDFVYANTAKEYGIINAQYHIYFSWSGRYFSNILLSIQPLVFDWIWGTKLVPVSFVIFLSVGIFALIKEIGFGFISTKNRITFALLFLFCYLHRMPDTGQGLYWMAGAMTYQAGNILTVFYFIFLLKTFRTVSRQGRVIFYGIIASLMQISAIGVNEITMLFILMVNLAWFFLLWYQNRKPNGLLTYFLILSIVFATFEMLSPGSTDRSQGILGNHEFIPALVVTISDIFKHIIFRILVSPAPLFSILLILFSKNITDSIISKNNKIFMLNPLIVLFISAAIIPMILFPVHWSLGVQYNHHRTINVVFFYSLLMWFYLLIVILVWLKQKHDFSSLRISVFLFSLFLFLSLMAPPNENKITRAYSDLLKGKSAEHLRLVKNRFEYLKNSGCKTCTIKDIYYPAKTIGHITFTPGSNGWINNSVAKYFGKEKLIVKYNALNTEEWVNKFKKTDKN